MRTRDFSAWKKDWEVCMGALVKTTASRVREGRGTHLEEERERKACLKGVIGEEVRDVVWAGLYCEVCAQSAIEGDW